VPAMSSGLPGRCAGLPPMSLSPSVCRMTAVTVQGYNSAHTKVSGKLGLLLLRKKPESCVNEGRRECGWCHLPQAIVLLWIPSHPSLPASNRLK
jgi:hypothetical protein